MSKKTKKIPVGTVEKRYIGSSPTPQAVWHFYFGEGTTTYSWSIPYKTENEAQQEADKFMLLYNNPLGTVMKGLPGIDNIDSWWYKSKKGWVGPYMDEQRARLFSGTGDEGCEPRCEETASTTTVPVPSTISSAKIMVPTLQLKYVRIDEDLGNGYAVTHDPVLQQLWKDQYSDYEEWRSIPCETVKLPARQYTIPNENIK